MRSRLVSAAAVLWFSTLAAAAADGQVWKNPSCGCCKGWVSHMAQNNFALDVVETDQKALDVIKGQNGIPPKLASCHTAKIGGYTVEGHVPAHAIKRLLTEKPDAVGLAVPGMPQGSPGMETGAPAEAYDILLVMRDGSTSVFEHVEP